MGADVEVQAKLTVDTSQAALALKNTSGQVRNVGQSFKGAQADGSSFIRNIATQAIAFNMGNIIHSVLDTGKSFIDAAAGAQEARRAMAATAVVLEGTPFGMAANKARETQKELMGIGLAAGFGGDEVRTAYNSILEATDGTAGAVQRSKVELAGTAKIADVFGLSLSTAGREVGMMHEGLLRTRGQMYQLLRSTGIFGSDTKHAAKAWMAMTDDERTKRLAYGLTQVGDKIKNLPPSFNRLVGQVGATFEGMRKDVGEPIVDALTPAIQDILPKLTAMRTDIRGIAQQFAPGISHLVQTWATTIEEKFAYINTHAGEIKEAITSGFEKAQHVVEWILAHKEELAMAFGAKAMLPGAMGAISTAKGFLGSVSTGAGGVGGVGGAAGFGHAGSGLLGAGSTVATALGATGTGAAVAASAAVAGLVVGLTGLAYAAYKLNDGLDEQRDDMLVGRDNLIKLAEAGKVEQLQQSIAQMQNMNREQGRFAGDMLNTTGLTHEHTKAIMMEGLALGHLDNETRNFYNGLVQAAQAVQHVGSGDHEAVTREINDAARAIADAYQQSGATADKAAQAVADNIYANQAAILVDAYNTAIRSGDQGAAALAATTIGSSIAVSNAFLESTKDIEGGFGMMADTLMASGAQFASLAGKLRGKDGAATMAPPQINMSGGQQFHITQDFRNQDADNVAVVFERDIGRMVQRRLSANTSSAFGT